MAAIFQTGNGKCRGITLLRILLLLLAGIVAGGFVGGVTAVRYTGRMEAFIGGAIIGGSCGLLGVLTAGLRRVHGGLIVGSLIGAFVGHLIGNAIASSGVHDRTLGECGALLGAIIGLWFVIMSEQFELPSTINFRSPSVLGKLVGPVLLIALTLAVLCIVWDWINVYSASRPFGWKFVQALGFPCGTYQTGEREPE